MTELQRLTGRYGTEEARAWRISLGKLSDAFHAPSFQPLHLYFGSRGNLALEYQLPASSSWCDVVLLGSHRSKASAVIIELKNWLTRNDKPGRFEGLIERQGSQELHPSDQVRGYTEYCRRFHSGVEDHNADVYGCALLTGDQWAPAYFEAPNAELVERYPLFTMARGDLNERFPAFFGERLSEPDEEFAHAFEDGRYRQNRGFVAQIGQQILNPKAQVFELLDNQRTAFALCRATLQDSFAEAERRLPLKKVVIVKGPPGSGKSVIAARLWASLVTDSNVPDGDVIFTTTSMSQNSNWQHLFNQTTGIEGAAGVVRKATSYSPISTHRLGQLRSQHGEEFLADASAWRENLHLLRQVTTGLAQGADDNQNLVSIVDEAHGLINPEHTEGRGNFGFCMTLGPQAYHIIRSSLVSVFLLDPLQGFRQRENTTIDDLREWAKELGAGEPVEISLEGSQFRCAGSTEYVSWIEDVLDGQSFGHCRDVARRWRSVVDLPKVADSDAAHAAGSADKQKTALSSGMDFAVFSEPEGWESLLKTRRSQGFSVRLLSTYSRPWATRAMADPHGLPARMMDFHERYEKDGEERYWSRIWNFVPRGGKDYTWYVTGHPAGRIANDPLCEVGCPYAVRGFDYDYIGIAWLNDLAWRDGKWVVDPFIVEESGIRTLTDAARREREQGRDGPKTAELLERVAQAYRILFTRAIRGAYVWVPDPETREHLLECLG